NLLEGSGENYPNDILDNLSGASANYNTNSTFNDRMSTRYIGMLSYNFDTRYLIDATYSYQGDSRFSSKYRGFYSVGLGWNIHKEPFVLDSPQNWIDVLRLKLGYGITGNASIAVNQYQTLLDFEQYDGNSASFVSGFGTDARWERS